ncbi:TPA: hypothetical protein EYP44_01070 [Candidatus Bathyarchaeota archaeon]|nr:hypothetical protein [Candidatus Bathyarchaeota archaeon]
MQGDVRVTAVGKVFEPSRRKFSPSRALSEYLRLVRWYLSLNPRSKGLLHRNGYEGLGGSST